MVAHKLWAMCDLETSLKVAVSDAVMSSRRENSGCGTKCKL